MSKIKLSHVVLYAKGWYHSTDNIVRDLQFALTLDGYSGEFFNKGNLANILVESCSALSNEIFHFKTTEILNGIRPEFSYKTGYYHNSSPDWCTRDEWRKGDYDYDLAIINYCLSGLRFLDKERWNPIKPTYGKGLGKPYRIKKKDVEEMFA
jgi:hypothetical protein